LIVQLKLVEPELPMESVAVAVTEYVPRVVGVPVMRPELDIDNPGGSPDADHV